MIDGIYFLLVMIGVAAFSYSLLRLIVPKSFKIKWESWEDEDDDDKERMAKDRA